MHRLFSKLLLLTLANVGFAQQSWQVVGKPIALTPVGQYFMQPKWSPDGKKIAMAGDSYRGIWVMSNDGQNLQQISHDIAAGFAFSWSSDSKEIVARTSEYNQGKKIDLVKVFNIENGNSRILKESKDILSPPEWTPDSQLVYFYTRNGIELVDSKRPDTLKSLMPSMQPVFYTAANEFVLSDSEGHDFIKIKPVEGRYLNATLSSDCEKIAFQVIGGDMYVVNIDGSNLVDLGRGEKPSWSPESEWLTYTIATDDGHRLISSDIYVIRINGAGKTNLTNTQDLLETHPDWSPNGREIIYNEESGGRIYKIKLTNE